jgi:CheY-like chemotaxis protein
MKSAAKILIVDDDRDLVETLKLVFTRQGYAVVAAYDAKQGTDAVVAERPDLIILDVMMPRGTEGFHFVWWLRQKPESYFRDVPIVMLTAIHEKTLLRFYPVSGDGTYRAGEYLPVQDFVDKPVDPMRLVERVERALAVARGAGAPA